MSLFWQDSNEPDEMEAMLIKSIPDMVVGPLNQNGFADYKWDDVQGNVRQWERKQIGEALGDLDSVEEQLNRELATCDELTLVVEGVWAPTYRGVLVFRYIAPSELCRLHQSRGPHHCPIYEFDHHPGLTARYEGLKWNLRRIGIEVVETPCMEVTAHALVAAYRNSLKPEHTTMRRYVRPHIAPFSPNIHVENLMRLKGDMAIGPERAQKVVATFGTFWKALSVSYVRLATVLGRAEARKLYEAIGKPIDSEV